MAIIFLNLVPGKYVEDIQTTQYTANAVKTIIDKFTITNVSSLNVTISANIVVENGSPSDINLILKTKTIAPSETYLCPELVGQILNASDFISTVASLPATLNLRISGREIN